MVVVEKDHFMDDFFHQVRVISEAQPDFYVLYILYNCICRIGNNTKTNSLRNCCSLDLLMLAAQYWAILPEAGMGEAFGRGAGGPERL